MTDATRLLTALRNELETAGLIRRPSDAGPLPPLHVEPRGGPPGPNDREPPQTDGELVVTTRLSSTLGEGPFDSYRARIVVDLLYRSIGTGGLKAGRALDRAIVDRIVKRADYAQGYTLDAAGSLPTLVLSANVFGGIGPLSEVGDVRTDIAKLVFEVLA